MLVSCTRSCVVCSICPVEEEEEDEVLTLLTSPSAGNDRSRISNAQLTAGETRWVRVYDKKVSRE